MGFEGLSSSVVIAIAAVLWLVYLVPTWFRRREYLSTERNAVRLQQTLRILAETAEVPDEIRVENSTRSVAEREKFMHREMQRTRAIESAQRAADARAAARTLAETRPAIAAQVARSSLASRRLRRSRLITTLVLVASIIGLVFGVAQVAAGAGVAMVIGSAVVALGAGVLLRQLAAVSTARAQLAAEVQAAPRVSTPVADFWQQPAEAQVRQSEGWVPTQLPKPLYLSRPEAPAVPRVSFSEAAARLARPVGDRAEAGATSAAERPAAPQLDAAAQLRDASERSENALREAQQQTARITPRIEDADAARSASKTPAVSAVPSRFAQMGVIGEVELAPTDLDEALRRRRAV
ncbi:hypothetical protein [Homoserinimonas hongtaonis]|uniref:Large exoprotein n=1 Tax=Homoserinimonas hongtaonis TaxID=2079791 RepID=A0A2U1T0D0_9MICO|nr:hypothetical protein [Salinibacterium hongtaonis]AWB89866.1 hypothetical protein C2138_10265 [Salinibacterium hongtaonis]PWB97330.1 hypothetical protein DF220_05440 [Salinibacterium hongtaonis]